MSSLSYSTPWKAEARVVFDCEGVLVATCASSEAARLIAAAPRMRAALWCELETASQGRRNTADDWQQIRETLLQAGDDPVTIPNLPEPEPRPARTERPTSELVLDLLGWAAGYVRGLVEAEAQATASA